MKGGREHRCDRPKIVPRDSNQSGTVNGCCVTSLVSV